jgi:hypothetical protein
MIMYRYYVEETLREGASCRRCDTETPPQDRYVNLRCHDNSKSWYWSPDIRPESRAHGRHGRPTLSNAADHPVNHPVDVNSTFHRNLVSNFMVAQIIIWNMHWPCITCRLRRTTYFNVRNWFLHLLWFLEWTLQYKSTQCLCCLRCNGNTACVLQGISYYFKKCTNEYRNWKD